MNRSIDEFISEVTRYNENRNITEQVCTDGSIDYR